MKQAYSEYKDSQLLGINKIPSDWGEKKIKFVSSVYNGNSLNDKQKEMFEDMEVKGVSYISSKDIDKDTQSINYLSGLKIPYESLVDFKLADKFCTLLCIEGGSAGRKISFTHQEVGFVNKLACFKSISQFEPKFLFYQINSTLFSDQFKLAMTGMIGGVSISDINNFKLLFPCYEVQQVISKYLDTETARIDKLIAEKKTFIKLLKEKRQALISHAVTKGLDPNVKMKDSGIEWIGEVPAHWEVCLIKNKTILITDGAHISPDTEKGVYPFISIRDIKNGMIDFKSCLLTSVENYEYLVRTGCKPAPGDILFSKDGTVGKTAIVQEGADFVTASSLITIRLKADKTCPDFFDLLCQSYVIQEQVTSLLSGAALKRLSLQNLMKVFGLFPPLPEQKKIARKLHKDICLISKLEDETKKSIKFLKEHRTALISAAVTGKIDVRNYEEAAA